MQTLHPADKDYGLMKIEEPKTPYSYYEESGEQNSSFEQGESSKLDLERLVQNMDQRPAKVLSQVSEFDVDDDAGDDEEDEDLSEEEKSKRKDFEIKRKMHYNEFQAVQLARKLLEQEEEDEEEEPKESDKGKDHDQPIDDSKTQDDDETINQTEQLNT